MPPGGVQALVPPCSLLPSLGGSLSSHRSSPLATQPSLVSPSGGASHSKVDVWALAAGTESGAAGFSVGLPSESFSSHWATPFLVLCLERTGFVWDFLCLPIFAGFSNAQSGIREERRKAGELTTSSSLAAQVTTAPPSSLPCRVSLCLTGRVFR